MKRHFTAYFEAYLTGALFFILQIALGFVAVGKGATLDLRMKWTSFDWYTFKANVIVFAFPTILAFLNSSVARGRANAAALPAVAPPSAPLATSFEDQYHIGRGIAFAGDLLPPGASLAMSQGFHEGLSDIGAARAAGPSPAPAPPQVDPPAGAV